MKKIGKLFLALGMIAFFAGCKTSTEELTLTKIEITNPADKVEYLVGEDLDTTGLEITATYSDESSKVVTGWTASGYDKTKAGEQTVTVTYTEEEVTVQTSYTVKVKEVPVEPEDPGKDPSKEPPKAELTKIEITTELAKKEYFVGAKELDLEGMVVTATYNDGTTKDVTADVKASGFDSSAATESQTITVTYGGKTATFTVKINPVLVTGIEITNQPTKKDYHIGDEIDLTGMVVTANYNDGSTKTLASNEYTVTGFDLIAYVDEQEITVTYNEKTAILKIKVAFDWYETPLTLPAGTNGTYGPEGTYVLFGVWPQDVVPVADVETLGLETSTDKVTRGYMEFVKGNDGNYYVKCNENRFSSSYTYTKDGSAVGTGSRWFKVMPIKWRVADTAYDVDGTNGNSTAKLLVAENILTASVPYYDYAYAYLSGTRTVGTKTGIYHNNYEFSQIRAYLNGLDYYDYYDTSYTETTLKNTYTNKGFLQTAFGQTARDVINYTVVDNSEDSTTDNKGYITKATDYACDPTTDKIFLLSEYEVTKYSKSTEAYYSDGQGNSRIRVTTDFAKANYAYQSIPDGYGGDWWLRSPDCHNSYSAHIVSNGGNVDYDNYNYVYATDRGVVPALSISF